MFGAGKDVPGGRAKMDNLSCSTRRAGLRPIGARAGFCNRTEVWTILTAGVFCACSPAAVQADPDPCTGVGVVTCSGNQSLGVLELTSGTTVLNVNSLTSTIAPPVGSGVPGILFFGSGDQLVGGVRDFRLRPENDNVRKHSGVGD